ncbi:MAG: DUF3267 domain-containing protein [Anaerolineales bacterium]
MRIQFGSPPIHPPAAIEADAGLPIRQPGRWKSAILSSLAGMILLSIPVTASIAYSVLFPEGDAGGSFRKEALPWAGMLISFALSIFAHELLHALLHPDFGRSDSTMLFIGWKKLQFGVYYEGRFPRMRWIFMRLLPFLALTILPLAVFLIVYTQMTYALETYLIIVMLTNGLGSGGDLVAAIIVLLQVPVSGALNFYQGRAYWLPAEGRSM